MIREGRDFIGSDGSVPALILKKQSSSTKQAVPHHRFKELINLNAPVVAQLKNSPSAVATLTKKQADQKVLDAVKIQKINQVSNAFRQLDKLVKIYKDRVEGLREVPSDLFARLLNSRLEILHENYQNGQNTVLRDWGKYLVNKKDSELTFKSGEDENYTLSWKQDTDFNTINLSFGPSTKEDGSRKFYAPN